MFPFTEQQIQEKTFIREFKNSNDSGDLHWHRDRENRIIQSIEPTNWMIQLDNELPKSLNEEVFIPMGMWHRVIKGDGDLKIRLIKL